jgi:hypothetical protein
MIMKRNGFSYRFSPVSENIRIRSTTDVFFYGVFLSQPIPLEGEKVVG